MTEQVDSSYAFIYPYYGESHNYVDIYLLSAMLLQFQLAPGSQVLVQGLDLDPIELLELRPRKGSDNPAMGKIPFIASIRMPNVPGTMANFLSAAKENGVRFASISSQGSKSEEHMDICLEGSLSKVAPLFDSSKAILLQLSKTAKEVGAELLSCSPVNFSFSIPAGSVISSIYLLDIPVLRGEYRKVRFNVSGRLRPLRTHENRLMLCRASLDSGRTTLSLDLSISNLFTSLLAFETADLPTGTPVSEIILQYILDKANVDAFNAFEYSKYDPRYTGNGPAVSKVQMGVIEMLLTCKEAYPCSEATKELKERLCRETWWKEDHSKIQIQSLEEALSNTNGVDIPEDTTCVVFTKRLNNGRYAFLEEAGKGTFGSVGKYVDLSRRDIVACKHVTDPKEYNEEELRSLIAATLQNTSRHLVAYRDFFYDGTLPVMVTDYVENVLANDEGNKSFAQEGRKHRHPSGFPEFLEMSLQILRGLSFLHNMDIEGNSIIHGDVKPANIGFIFSGETIVWKLLDFGLTKRLPKGVQMANTPKLGGTLAYASPQVLKGQKRIDNDIYALGIVLFQVLNDWRHPTRAFTNDFWDKGNLPEPAEYNMSSKSAEPVVYPKAAWRLGYPFSSEGLEADGEKELQDIIYKMIELSPDRRFTSDEEVIEALEEWGSKYLDIRSS